MEISSHPTLCYFAYPPTGSYTRAQLHGEVGRNARHEKNVRFANGARILLANFMLLLDPNIPGSLPPASR